MTALASAIDPQSADFARNTEAMKALVADLRAKLDAAMQGGSEEARARHAARGKLLARELINLLLDPGAPFLELSPLAAYDMYGGDVHSASLITGIGRISGRECVVIANDATIKGGTYYPMTVKKHLRAQDIARENHLPCVYMVDSGGAFLPLQDEIFPDERHFGRIFYNQEGARLHLDAEGEHPRESNGKPERAGADLLDHVTDQDEHRQDQACRCERGEIGVRQSKHLTDGATYFGD
jgi:3-methylcrotonyl-CoA carboxylase beta subunit